MQVLQRLQRVLEYTTLADLVEESQVLYDAGERRRRRRRP